VSGMVATGVRAFVLAVAVLAIVVIGFLVLTA
jgi:hypothetical protein